MFIGYLQSTGLELPTGQKSYLSLYQCLLNESTDELLNGKLRLRVLIFANCDLTGTDFKRGKRKKGTVLTSTKKL